MQASVADGPHPGKVDFSVTKKMAPFLGPRFKEAKWWAISGKAKQVVVPPVGTALREMFRREESEGHCFGCGLLVTWERSICGAKAPQPRQTE